MLMKAIKIILLVLFPAAIFATDLTISCPHPYQLRDMYKDKKATAWFCMYGVAGPNNSLCNNDYIKYLEDNNFEPQKVTLYHFSNPNFTKREVELSCIYGPSDQNIKGRKKVTLGMKYIGYDIANKADFNAAWQPHIVNGVVVSDYFDCKNTPADCKLDITDVYKSK